MTQVKLAKNWFGPGGVRYRAGVVEVPSGHLDQLPSTAKVIEAPKPKDEPKPVAAK